MRIDELKIESFFAEHEFSTEYVMCASDAEAMSMRELLSMADVECHALWNDLALGYTETWGHPLLREAVADQYAGLGTEHILIFSGAQEAIFALMNAELNPGDHVVVATPCWQPLYSMAEALGAHVTRVRMGIGHGFGFDAARIADAVRPDTRMIVINAPNNPTGALPSHADLGLLRRIAEDVGATLVSDEIYRLLEHDPAFRLPAAVETSDSAVSIGVVSKVYGLAGLRIGWLASKNVPLLRRAAGMKHYTTICASGPSEVLATIGLRHSERLLTRTREIVRDNLLLLDEFVDRYRCALNWSRPQAGTVAFPRLRLDIAVRRFVDMVREEVGVLLLPGDVFDEPGGYLRIGYGRRDMPAALERLDHFLTKYDVNRK